MDDILEALRDIAGDLEQIGELAVGELPQMGKDMAQTLKDIADDLEANVEYEEDDEGSGEYELRRGRQWQTN